MLITNFFSGIEGSSFFLVMNQNLTIHDNNVSDIVISFANSLDIPYVQEKNVYFFNLPSSLGNGVFKGYDFNNGLGVIYCDFIPNEDFHFELTKSKIHPLKLIFNLGEEIKHRLETHQDYNAFNQLEILLTASTPSNNHRFIIPKGSHAHIFQIDINRKKFENRISDFFMEHDQALEDIFRDVMGVVPFSHKSNYSYKIEQLINEFRFCYYKGFMKKIFQEAKALEILTCYLEQFVDDSLKSSSRNILRSQQSDIIRKAAAYLRSNLDRPITIKELANKVGLNANILQSGFRHIYGTSVSEFQSNLRMDQARIMVLETDMTFSQISDSIGISSKSYFSKLFLEKYGMLPSNFRKKYGKLNRD